MPIAEFYCGGCNHKWEKVILSREEFDSTITEGCPKCGANGKCSEAPRTSARFMPGGAGGFHSPSKL